MGVLGVLYLLIHAKRSLTLNLKLLIGKKGNKVCYTWISFSIGTFEISQIWSIAVWAGFSERTRDGNKYVVAERSARQVRRSFCAEKPESIIEMRRSRRENASNGFFDGSGNDVSSSSLLDALFTDEWLGQLPGCFVRWRMTETVTNFWHH